ncbi:hypothetical protein [Rickettsia japonica]|uniref:Uncharacterized protein n=2 Tax=Rickettsia japonica TaxID=35790 RepID=G4KNJ7_RICJY|nr:hypothetical protein [Rickettsia japonica]BAK96855.1 hypothetical protein RJP_0650 [Rickettsia japonica YH]BAW82983.1 predicted protein [Rickettsia japonica]
MTAKSSIYYNVSWHTGMQEDLSYTAKLANHLIHKNGTQWLDVLDQALNLYQLGTQTMQIAGDIRKLVASTSLVDFKEKFTKS